jgi:hypothetical protein
MYHHDEAQKKFPDIDLKGLSAEFDHAFDACA